jgi:hypothetical protein
MLLGLAIAVAQQLPGPIAAVGAHDPATAGRKIGDVKRAILAPGVVGPFGLPEVGLLVALVATWLAGALLLPAGIPEPLRLGSLVLLGAVAGAEAWIRSMPAPARRAFEAFSWLGEWEIANVRALTGGGVPTTPLAARQWLLAHPERPEDRWLRVEILVLAGQLDEARAVAGRMPATTPAERVDRAVSLDLADWFAGGPGDVAAMQAAAAGLEPDDDEGRLRAEVAVAVAQVRRRMAEGVDLVEAGAPLREVRERLGRRADGQLGRAMRGRLQRTLLLVGGVFAGITLVLGSLLPAA